MEVIKSSPNRTEEEQLDFYEQMFNALADKIRLTSKRFKIFMRL